MPETIRAISGSAGVGVSAVIANAGERPSGFRSVRLRSPSAAKAWSRMCSIGPVVERRLATVKSQARTRFPRATPARRSGRKTLRIEARRALIAFEPVARRSRSARNPNVGAIARPDAVLSLRRATT